MTDELQKPALTPARLALGRTGPAVPTREHLRFQLDHALARDAVHAQLDLATLRRALDARHLPHLTVSSAAQNKSTYLRRPDLGRTLSPSSRELLAEHATTRHSQLTHSQLETEPDSSLALILADGLSALALERHAIPLLDELLQALDPGPLAPGPVILATHARVALGDEIGALLHAKLTLLLIGERPGLSSPDSLGAYITFNPRPGRTDADRNCISNIRAEGLSYRAAAARIAFYLREALRLQTTGVSLKDPAPNHLREPI